ncbi:hypothetical protein CN918_32510 [Priestia megaterium]|nr:hypothetical protein CN918_32510 [Priestia megaterium]
MSVLNRYKYTMGDTMSVAKQAAIEIELFLHSLPQTLQVVNVESDPSYQKKDVDLLYYFHNRQNLKKRISIEIKGDRHHYTGNYFFETHSNLQKNTPGCFMYTEADFLFYYYLKEKELHILPVKETREWFIENIDQFPVRGTSTQIGNFSKKGYATSGRLVPRDYLLQSVPRARFIQL